MDTLSKAERSERMSRIRSKDGKPELIVRRLVHAMGYRYRLHDRRLPGSPDMVFPSRRKAMFVHGCFWHRHPSKRCALARLPKSRLDFWLPKLEANARRDRRNGGRLNALGWSYMVVWECQLRELDAVRNRIVRFLESNRRVA